MSIILNDSLQINAPKAVDSKYMKFSGGITQPYASNTEVNSTILSAYRYQYLVVLAFMNGDPVEYWYRGGTADGNLETKSKESYTFNTSASVTLSAGYLYNKIIILPQNNITNLIIGTTNGGNDIEPGTAVNASTVYTLDYPNYIVTATPIYFGNLSSGTKILLYKTY